MGGKRRGQVLVGLAIVASLALVGTYLAAGGASYAPAEAQNPCEDRAWRDPEGIEQLAEQFSLSALDGAACELGVTRETLARALTSQQARGRFIERYGLSETEFARAIRAGLLRAVDDAEAAGALNPFIAAPLRATLRSIPLDQAVELVQNAEALLGDFDSFLGPAQGLLEQFFP